MGVIIGIAGDFRPTRIELGWARRSLGPSPLLRERVQLFLEQLDRQATQNR
jgi:hypothetical protein